MLSEELRKLALWLLARRRLLDDPPVADVHLDDIVANVLEGLAEEAERLERGTRLLSADEVAERISVEGLPR